MATGKLLFNHRGVKIELSQGVIFRLTVVRVCYAGSFKIPSFKPPMPVWVAPRRQSGFSISGGPGVAQDIYDEAAYRRFAEELKEALGTENNTGQTEMIPTWPITKILWLKRNEPEVYGKIHKYLLVDDYVVYRLTGEFKGEYALYTSSYMLDIRNKTWWREILEYVGVGEDQLVDLFLCHLVVVKAQPSNAVGYFSHNVPSPSNQPRCQQTALPS